MASFLYFAFGLKIRSQLQFSELCELTNNNIIISDPVDVEIYHRAITSEELHDYSTMQPTNTLLIKTINPYNSSFLIKNGNIIVVDTQEECDICLIKPIILGTIFSLLLRQRGLLVLHASAILICNKTVAFLGNSGMGKSTLANAFCQNGGMLITDDVMAVNCLDDKAITYNSYPYTRLLPDAAKHLGYNFNNLFKLHPLLPKRNNFLPQDNIRSHYQVDVLYLLDFGEDLSIENVHSHEALVNLIHHTRATNIMNSLSDQKVNLELCCRCLNQVSLKRLRREVSIEKIDRVVQSVINDIQANAY